MVIIRSSVFFVFLLFFVQASKSIDAHPLPLVEGITVKEKWITIFVHGTYGTSLTLMSFPKIFRGDSRGTYYEKFQSKFRDNKNFYQNRFMHDLGLIPVGPSYFQKKSHHAEKITNSIVGFYQEVSAKINPGTEELCYAYGWSGLLNQHERRLAAVELYNRLIGLYEDFRLKGDTPRFRLICHSHGGNVGLNLAAVHEASEGSKQATFIIDELIMYATPIQQETERFCFSSFFKKVFNIYSENDVIQSADFISTSTRLCSRRIEVKNYPELDASRLAQIQITVGQPVLIQTQRKNLDVKGALRGGRLYSSSPKDPAHADFWCVTWEKHDVFYDPLPLVVFTPIFTKLLSPFRGYQDLIINIAKNHGEQKVGAYFTLVDKNAALINSIVFPLSLVKKMRDAFYKIEPKKTVYSLSFGRTNKS